MADGKVEIEAGIDAKGLEEGLKKISNSLKDTGKEVQKYAEKSDKALDKALQKLTLEAQAKGKSVSAQDKYNAILKNYIDLMTESNGVIKEGSEIEKKRRGQLEAARREMEKSTSSIDKLKDAFSSGGTIAAVLGTVTKATKKAGEIIRETSDAYKVQINAENSLALAAEKNPYINSDAVNSLKEFASEMQGVSNLGDEFIIGFETQLVAAGRTQAEIEKIIKAAADISVTGAMSFESAVTNLNKTFGGTAGELGEVIPELKNLTQEELAAGAAVDLLGQKYEGMAAELADAKTQAQNAKGDFQEAIGALTAPTANAWDNFWKAFYEKGIQAINWVDEKLTNISNRMVDKDLLEAFSKNYEVEGKQQSYAYFMSDEDLNRWEKYLASKRKLKSEEQQMLILIRAEKSTRKAIVYQQEEEAKAAADAKKAQEEANRLEKERLELIEKQKKAEEDRRAAADKTAAGIKSSSDAQLITTLGRMKEEATARGEELTAQEKYNVVWQNYLDLMYNAQDPYRQLITLDNQIMKDRRDQLAALEPLVAKEKEEAAAKEAQAAAAKKAAEEQKAAEKELEEMRAGLEGVGDLSKYEQLEQENEALAELKQQYIDNELIQEEERKAAIKKIDEEIARNKRESVAMMIEDSVKFAEESLQIAQDAGALFAQYNKNQTEAELGELEKKYEAGEIGEKEYNEKKAEIKKQAAREEYKQNMFQWTASLLAATANIAQGVSKAIAQGGIAGIATGALVAAAGGVQIASIVGSKPQPPAFQTGGIVGGNSFSGDNILARVNSGEMILNTTQQKALFDMANGSTAAAAAPNIIINNSAANIVSAQPRISKNDIEIMIDTRVNESLQAGKYDTSLTIAEQGKSGEFLGI